MDQQIFAGVQRDLREDEHLVDLFVHRQRDALEGHCGVAVVLDFDPVRRRAVGGDERVAVVALHFADAQRQGCLYRRVAPQTGETAQVQQPARQKQHQAENHDGAQCLAQSAALLPELPAGFLIGTGSGARLFSLTHVETFLKDAVSEYIWFSIP